MSDSYFASLLPTLGTRAARATIGQLGFSNPPLRQHLLDVFARGYGEPGCFLGDPVFEATFGWQQADATFGALAGTLLHRDLVDALDKPWGDSARDYRFPRSARPYTHQLDAWQALLAPQPRSVVVTSGTGSGKTECFMVPVLSSLAAARVPGQALEGVRALFLYPLNALIQSQRERLRAWTGPFAGDLRFCLYNGMTPEEGKAERYREAPNEVHDRATLRRSPPPILVTNPTMLEYMLVRAQDAPILERSHGTLEWIVLDEAHNYIGSQAAELALLLRRVLHAFGTEADRVRFVATSATIGAGDAAARTRLQEFLARLAGVPGERVLVVEGTRHVPQLEGAPEPSIARLALQDLAAAGTAEEAADANAAQAGRYQRLCASPAARRLRELFVPALSGRSYQPLSAVKAALRQAGMAHGDADALAWLDLLTSAVERSSGQPRPFLPLRLHVFHNTLNGLWACADPGCARKAGTALAHADWPFGLLYLEERRHCACGAPVYPLASCNDCNETFLRADFVHARGQLRLVPPRVEDVDEFVLDRDPEERVEDATEKDDGDAEQDESAGAGTSTPALIVNGVTRGAPIALDRASLEQLSKPTDAALRLRVQDLSAADGRWVLRCPCCEGSEPPDVQFRKAVLGAPFLMRNIIPTLLEFCPDGDKPLDSPMRGRRMITFTDSRQGTARIAAQLQQDAERTALRAGVYRRLVTGTAGATGERAAIEAKIAGYKNVLDMLGGSSEAAAPIRVMLQAEEAALARLAGGKAVPLHDMTEWLASQSQDVGRWTHAWYADSDSLFRAARGKELLAEMLLCREFARRPKRQNSLESMGLVAVQYPKLAQLAVLRPAVEQAGFTLREWQDFLKICLDHFVRQAWCLNLPSSWRRWGGQRVHARFVLSPKSVERSTSRFIRWPRVLPGERQNRLVRLLACVLRLDPCSDVGRDRIDALLLAAWEDLTLGTGLLQLGDGQGRSLHLDDMALRNVTRAWVCPVTRRVLDTTLRGVTPYLPPGADRDDAVARCRAIEVPVCDLIAHDHASDEARVAAVRAWLDQQPYVQQARLEGLWTNVNDRVLEGTGYFRAVEHSAQQPGSRLEHYEAQFKRGAVNLMSCSTTMEMGVDIGGITMVAMNNVPPHPANYLQRAGRAGRRAETRSVALTVCKNNPHDQHVFAHTTWPFDTRLPTPGISLQSPVLVQRHVNALLLSKFLRLQDRQGRLDKLTLEWWMLPRDGKSRQERFVAWCECFNGAQHADTLAGLESLVRRTVFEGRASPLGLIRQVGEQAAHHAEGWLRELQAIDAQMAELSRKEESDRVPLRALEIQRRRLTGEYLLRELASSGFLPGYGFPTDITSFETLNKDSEEIARSREQAATGREDNRFQRRELPSRDTVTALREYAPGASVVIDGLVYESAGITLNWHAPATQDEVNELQNIRQAWRCRHCGASGTSVLAARLQCCPECGGSLGAHGSTFRPYLEPAGFSVDLFEATHNDITQQKYVAPELPWISGSGEWMALANPALGRFRASTEGSVFHYSAGPHGSGYAVCLECGRAAPMGARDAEGQSGLPAVFQRPHKRLRGRRGAGDDQSCGGSDNDFKIKRGLHFGREYATDVLELSLVGTDGHALLDASAAYTLAVALRRAIARHLGIDEGELGCDSKELRGADGRRSRTLQIFDMRTAGYSSLVAPELPRLLADARALLECAHECDSACQQCLLSYDTRFRTEDLDRKAALAFLTPQWLDALALPEAERLFGPDSRAEYQPLAEALTRELNHSGARRLFVYLHGAGETWDLPVSPLKRLLHRLSVKSGVSLCLVVPQAELSGVAVQDATVLRSLQAVCGVELAAGSAPPLRDGGWCLATVQHADGQYRSWGTLEAALVPPGPLWGQPGARPVVAAPSPAPVLLPQPVHLPEPAAVAGGWTLELTGELDGDGSGFGKRFWSALGHGDLAAVLPADKRVEAVRYEDRYLATPIACALLVEVVSALKTHYEALDGWADPQVQVFTMLLDEERSAVRRAGLWSANWPRTTLRDAALRAAFDYAGVRALVRSEPRSQLIHARRLVVSFTDGTQLRVVPDQGLSYWTLARSQWRTPWAVFDMDAEPEALGQRLAEIRLRVEGSELPTLVAVDRG